VPDNRYLMRQRQCWFVSVEVPPSLRGALGRRLKRTLQTRDVAVARACRYRVVAELKALIEKARKGPQGDPLWTEALSWRDSLKTAEEADGEAGWGPSEGYQTQEEVVSTALGDRVEALHDAGDPRWREFRDVAWGKLTPLLHHVDDWLEDGAQNGQPLKAKTASDRRGYLHAFGQWLTAERMPVTIETVTRQVAARYVSAAGKDRTPASVIAKLIALRGYWAWLSRRGYLPEDARNPWEGQAPRVRRGDPSSGGRERAFTDAEIVLLLSSPVTPTMHEFISTAALTGMRREEIARLRVKDCQGGVFVVRHGKTAAAVRRVPVHSQLASVVDRRITGKVPEAFLFADLPGKQEDSRASAIGHAFVRYRRSLGIQEGGGRRSLVNFHSFRRWFVTAAIRAEQPPHLVSVVAGHSEGLKGMTLGRYYAGPTDEQLRAVVEAVKLPDGVRLPT
jgi:integrase